MGAWGLSCISVWQPQLLAKWHHKGEITATNATDNSVPCLNCKLCRCHKPEAGILFLQGGSDRAADKLPEVRMIECGKAPPPLPPDPAPRERPWHSQAA